MQWPPYSSDLNLIENAWPKLKQIIHRIDPNLQSFKGTSSKLRQHFSGLIEQAWKELGQQDDYFDGLVLSMSQRVEAVIEAKGWCI